MRRGPRLGLAAGVLLLLLAVAAALLARGAAEASSSYRALGAEWQRGVAVAPAAPPGRLGRVGEALLGVRAEADVLRAYRDYRAGLANRIPGTRFPQTRARFEVVRELRRLGPRLGRADDRARVGVALGVVLAAGAAGAGEQRAVQLRRAIEAFRLAALEDPANEAAKLDLEVLLRMQTRRASARPQTAQGTSNRQRQPDRDPRGPVAPAGFEGTGF